MATGESSFMSSVAVGLITLLMLSVIILAVVLPIASTAQPSSGSDDKKPDDGHSSSHSDPSKPPDNDPSKKYSDNGTSPTCKTDRDCMQYRSNNYCDPATKKCVCGTNIAKCGGATPYCLPAYTGTCVECIDWADCPPGTKCNDNNVCASTSETLHCTANNTCPYGYYCSTIDGACHQQCRTTADCDTLQGQTCDQEYGICVVNRCSADSQCTKGYHCDEYTGRCAAYSGCNDNSQCLDGYHCDTSKGTCVANSDEPECSADTDCPEGYWCDGSSGSCKKNIDPPPLHGSCATDKDCRNGYYCDAATLNCVKGDPPPQKCSTDSDCTVGQYCDTSDHKCYSRQNCPMNGCPDHYYCADDRSCQLKTCTTDAECDDDEMCQDGNCLPVDCETSDDCVGDGSETYICGPDSTCVRGVKPPPLGCSSNEDCSTLIDGHYCDKETSVCTNVCNGDKDCVAGGNCVKGTCAVCLSDSDCKLPGYSCNDVGTCVAPTNPYEPNCKENADCTDLGTGYYCDANAERCINTCETTDDCVTGGDCLKGTCVYCSSEKGSNSGGGGTNQCSTETGYYCNDSTGQCSNTCNNVTTETGESVCPPGFYCKPPTPCADDDDECKETPKDYVCTNTCSFSDDPVCPSGYTCFNPNNDQQFICMKNRDNDGLGAGAIIGIIISCFIVIIVFGLIIYNTKTSNDSTSKQSRWRTIWCTLHSFFTREKYEDCIQSAKKSTTIEPSVLDPRGTGGEIKMNPVPTDVDEDIFE